MSRDIIEVIEQKNVIEVHSRGPQGVKGEDGAGVPIGGEVGQVLMKIGGNQTAWTSLDEHVKSGIADYNHNTDDYVALDLPADTWVDIPNDGNGFNTMLDFLPLNATQLLNTSTGRFDFSELAPGDWVLIRNDYAVNPSVNGAELQLRYQLGTGAGSYTLPTVIGELGTGSGKYYRYSLKPDLLYMGNADTINNPITLQLKLSVDGTVRNFGSAIGVITR
mgnify:CR=1 FL=1